MNADDPLGDHPGLLHGWRCLACEHDWGEHFPAFEACALCTHEAAREPFLSSCRLSAERGTSRA